MRGIVGERVEDQAELAMKASSNRVRGFRFYLEAVGGMGSRVR